MRTVIAASNLQTAIQLTSALVINDGKYEKWQDIFFKQVKEATGLPWKDKGWTEKMDKGENTHTLTFAIPECTLTFIFTEDANGYFFWRAFAKFKTPLPGKKEPGNVYMIGRIPDGTPAQGAYIRYINNGHDLIAAIVRIVGIAGLKKTAAEPAAPTTPAVDATAKREVLAAIKEAIKAIESGAISRNNASQIPAMFQKISFSPNSRSPIGMLKDLETSISLDAAEGLSKADLIFITNQLEDFVAVSGLSKNDVMDLLKKVKSKTNDWSVRDRLLETGRLYLPNFDYVSLDEAQANKILDDLIRMVRTEELDHDDAADIYEAFERYAYR